VMAGGRGQYCVFFESVLAKKMRTDPARPPSLTHCSSDKICISCFQPVGFGSRRWLLTGSMAAD